MAKEYEVTKEDGTVVKETAFTPEEMAAKDAEIERLKTLSEEKTNNFKQVNEKTDKLETELTSVKTTLDQKIAAEKESAKTNSGMRYHGNKEDLKAKVESNYAILSGMPEGTPEEISARMEAAARLSGINVESRGPSPLNIPIDGDAPKQNSREKEDEFLKSEKGVAAQKAMGFSDEDITPKQ